MYGGGSVVKHIWVFILGRCVLQELLEGPNWQQAVLGVSGMARRAAEEACVGVRGRRRCVLNNSRCQQGTKGRVMRSNIYSHNSGN